MNNDRSLDLTELLSKIHKQAVLVGGPHDGKRAPLPPMIYEGEHPLYLCQPGRPFDQTYYHYRLLGDTTYVYVDHCDTLPGFPHRPDEIEDEQERNVTNRILFAACLLIVVGWSAITVGLIIWYLLSWIFA